MHKEKWVSPTTVFKLIEDLVRIASETDETIKKKREYGKTRESWIAAVFLIRKILTDGKVWYLRKNDLENSIDDIYARSFIVKDGKVWSDHPIAIQAFQVTEKSPSLKKAIEDKLKDDLSNVSLVGYILRSETINWKELHAWIKQKKPKANDIHLIANVKPSTHTVFQIFPELNFTEFSINLCILGSHPVIEAEQVINENHTQEFYIGKALVKPNLDIES